MKFVCKIKESYMPQPGAMYLTVFVTSIPCGSRKYT